MQSKILLYCTNQIRITFSDEIGNVKTASGTGFWIGRENGVFFVTNAHNLNPSMHKSLEKFELTKLEILLRLKGNGQ